MGHIATSTKCTRHVQLHVLAKSHTIISVTSRTNVPKVAQYSRILFNKTVSINLAFHLIEVIVKFFHIPWCSIDNSDPHHYGLSSKNFEIGFAMQQALHNNKYK